jgi:hypothetical protein
LGASTKRARKSNCSYRKTFSKKNKGLNLGGFPSLKKLTGLSPILFKRHIWRFLEAQNTIYGGRFPENFA